MKREHPDSMTEEGSVGGSSSSSKCTKSTSIWEDGGGGGGGYGGVDELLAGVGYKVKSADMTDVAQMLEQLEMAMGTEDGISHLSSDTVHYNPSDISGWLESMLSEITPDPMTTSTSSSSSNHPMIPNLHSSESIASAGGGGGGGGGSAVGSAVGGGGSSVSMNFPPRTPHNQIFEDDDLRLIPGIAACNNNNNNNNNNNKRIKHHDDGGGVLPVVSSPPARPLVVVDSQEAGVRLVHTLMACAEAVHNDNLKLAESFLKQIGLLAVSQAGAMRRVATFFAEALARRIYKISPHQSSIDSSYSDVLLMHFYETCPYLQFAHFTANQAIIEALTGADQVHLIDFGIKQGMQWPPVMQYLALRPGGPPTLRLTAIGPPQTDNTDALQQVGWKLAQIAKSIGVEFHYRGYVCESLADLDAAMLEIKDGETVVVNSVFELHRLLARPGAIEKVMSTIKTVRPKIVTVVEQEANHNGPVFVDRFNEALYYYSAMFDSLEGCGLTQTGSQQDVLMSEVYLGRQICNVVACEGPERVERHESLSQWRIRMESAGFDPVHLGSNAFKQASMLLLAHFAGNDGYRVEENGGCLLLGWHTRPLIATSAWRLSSSAAAGTTSG